MKDIVGKTLASVIRNVSACGFACGFKSKFPLLYVFGIGTSLKSLI